MDKHKQTLHAVKMYRQLQALFHAFNATAQETFPRGNEYGIEILEGDAISRRFLILDNPCRVRFDVTLLQGRMLGEMHFERLLAEDRTKELLAVEFDHEANATHDPDAGSFPNSLRTPGDLRQWLAIELLQRFFASL